MSGVQSVAPAGSAKCAACDTPSDMTQSILGIDRLHGTLGAFAVSYCPSCGTGMTQPAMSAAELAAFYPDEYGPYDESMGSLVGAVSRVVRRVQGRRALARQPLRTLRGISGGRIVDVGCGRGDLAAIFVKRGWDATGVDPSASACAIARTRGVDARTGTLDDVPLETSTYDAALFHHSLEHTPDPGRDLARIRDALKPGGLAIVTVPNFGSWQPRRFQDRWYHLDLPRHRTHFTAHGLAAVIERSGLRVEAITSSSSAVGLPATLQYALFGRCLFPRGTPLRIATGLCVVALPFVKLVDRAFGAGDQLHAVARRPYVPAWSGG